MRIFSEYEKIEAIGRGGMGKVYKARIPMIDEIVAVKVFDPAVVLDGNRDECRKRFVREARILWKLNHPNIVPVYHVGSMEGEPCYVMEYISDSLARLLGTADVEMEETAFRKILSEDEVYVIGGRLLHALRYLHENGVVHRDVKPENILLADQNQVKLSDFGIAKLVQGTTMLTVDGNIMGTLRYSAPEQLNGGNVDRRSDLYSVGILLYVMLTRKHPSDVKWADPRDFRREISPGWKYVIDGATEPNPENRFPDADAMLDRLHDIVAPKYRLRNTPVFASPQIIDEAFGRNIFHRLKKNIVNEYRDNGDGTVTDSATGLMWQKSGSENWLNRKDAEKYIRELNRKKFAGYDDWRFPTIDELQSLVVIEKDVFRSTFNTIFDRRQWVFWSNDKYDSGHWRGYHPEGDDCLVNLYFVRAVRERQSRF